MKKLLDRFWFLEAPAARPAWFRLIVGIHALWYVGDHYSVYLRMGATDAALFTPVGLASFLDAPLSIGAWQAFLIAALVANVFFILGAFHRISGPVFAVLLLFVFCYRNSWSMIYHSHNLLVLHVLVLGITPSADALSLDAWWRGRKGSASIPGSDVSWKYGWALQLICAVTVATYFVSGMAKVAGPLGWAWAEGEAFRSQIAMDGLRKELLGKPAAPLAYVLYDQVALFTLMGVTTFIMELGAPLALLGRRIGLAWAVGAYGLHWGIVFLMNIYFDYQLWGIAFLPFLPLERIADWIRRLPSRLLGIVRKNPPLPSSEPGSSS